MAKGASQVFTRGTKDPQKSRLWRNGPNKPIRTTFFAAPRNQMFSATHIAPADGALNEILTKSLRGVPVIARYREQRLRALPDYSPGSNHAKHQTFPV